jgi:hypothetical protein
MNVEGLNLVVHTQDLRKSPDGVPILAPSTVACADSSFELPSVHWDVSVFVGSTALVVHGSNSQRVAMLPFAALYSVTSRRSPLVTHFAHSDMFRSGPGEPYMELLLFLCRDSLFTPVVDPSRGNGLSECCVLCACGNKNVEHLRTTTDSLLKNWGTFLSEHPLPLQEDGTLMEHKVAMSLSRIVQPSVTAIQRSAKLTSTPQVVRIATVQPSPVAAMIGAMAKRAHHSVMTPPPQQNAVVTPPPATPVDRIAFLTPSSAEPGRLPQRTPHREPTFDEIDTPMPVALLHRSTPTIQPQTLLPLHPTSPSPPVGVVMSCTKCGMSVDMSLRLEHLRMCSGRRRR